MFGKGLDLSKKVIKRSKIQFDEFVDFNLKSEFFRFAVIIVIDNSKYDLEKTIERVTSQTIDFEKNVELILINKIQDGIVDEICSKYCEKYKNNVIYINRNLTATQARNLGIEISNAKYINFINPGDCLNQNALSDVDDFFKKYYYDVDIVSIPIKDSDNQIDEEILADKFDSIRILDLNKEANYIQNSLSSVFFKNEAFSNVEFEEKYGFFDEWSLFGKIASKKMKIGLIPEACCVCSEIPKINPEFIDENHFHEYAKLIKDDETPDFIRYDILHFTGKIFESNQDVDKTRLQEVLKRIDDELIIKQRHADKSLKYSMLLFKHENDCKIEHDNEKITKKVNGTVIDDVRYHKIYIDYVEIYKNTLYLGGFLKSFFTAQEIEIKAEKITDNKTSVFDAKLVEYPQRDERYLNRVFEPYLNFEFEIPLSESENATVNVNVGNRINLDLFFNGYVHLSKESFYSKKENYLIKYEDNSFNITKYDSDKLLELEDENINYLISKEDSELNEAIEFRKYYLSEFENYESKKIWLFMDRPDSADDNAEHLFKYAVNQNDDIEKYFIISKESKDYNRLKGIGNVIDYGSKEHMLLVCFADKIITSHPDDEFANPFYHKTEKYYNGLFSAKVCFLQHGIIINDISSWLHKYDKFLYLIVTSAKKEYHAFFDFPYNYSESVVHLLGLPRFDNLDNKNLKNQILIMPTWRRFMEDEDENQIKDSKYFKGMNSLLNNDKLIEFLKDNNYEIVFRPHQNLKEYSHLFSMNEYVICDFESSYQTLLNESKLLITDYSSISFDFAYLKKPVIYYQYDKEDFHFEIEDSYYDFCKMGFGEVTATEKGLIGLIKNYISNDCAMKAEFENRIAKFYEFSDKNNCMRVYNKLLEIN